MIGKRTSSLVALGALALSLGACRQNAAEAEPRRPPLVEAVQARAGSLPLEERVFGVVRADNQVEVRPEIAAPVVAVLVESGARVTRGQVLVRLDDEELREQLRSARAEVLSAEAAAAEADARAAELQTRAARVRRLAADELVSEQELETLDAQLAASRASAKAAQARVQQVRAAVDERQAALSRTVVRAPVAGRVGERRAEIGMRADPSTTLFRVGNLDRVIVNVTLSEGMMANVSPGRPALIRPRDGAAGGGPIVGSVARVSPFLDERSFTTTAEIDLDNANGRLRPGMFVEATILYGESEQATLIPTSALWEDPRSGERGVFVVTDGEDLTLPSGEGEAGPDRAYQVALRQVRVLAEGRGQVGVEPVAAGDWVVVTGQHLLRRAAGEEGADGVVEARIRPATWERVDALQGLQREDLLEGFLAKQRAIAAVFGAAIPASEAEVERALAP